MSSSKPRTLTSIIKSNGEDVLLQEVDLLSQEPYFSHQSETHAWFLPLLAIAITHDVLLAIDSRN